MFLGPTGAGKSSTAVGCSARDATLLADDFALIDSQMTAPAVWPADVGVRLWDDVGDAINTPGARFPVAEYTDKKRLVPRADVTMELSAPVPIGAVVVLAQRLRPGAAPDLTASSPADAVIRVVENSHRIDVTSATANRKALDKAAHLVDAVPFFQLRLPGSIDCLLDNCSSALELVRESLEHESVRRSALGKR